MKNFKIKAVFICVLLILSSCGQKELLDEQPYEIAVNGSTTSYSVRANNYYASGMRYKVFSSPKGHVFIVNITKDSLEVSKSR